MMPTAPPLATRDTPHRFYRWELLALLCGAFFLHQGDRAIFGVALTSIRTDLGLSDEQMGLIGTALFATLAVMMPLAGYLGDIWNRKWIITASLVFWSSATMITGLARGVMDLVLFRSVATAGGESFYAPAAYPLLAAFHRKTRALAMSVHQAALYAGVIAGGIVGGAITQHCGWRWTFYWFGGAGIALGLVLAVRLKNAPRGPQAESPAVADRVSPGEALAVLFRTPTALLLTVGFTAIVLVNNAYVVWAPGFIEKKFGLSVAEAGAYAMLYHHLAALVGVLAGGPLSDAMVLRRRRFRLELQAFALFLGAPAIAWMGMASELTATWIAMAAVGLFRGLFEANTHATLFDVIPPRYRASSVGVMVMTAFLAGSASPSFLGFCCERFPPGQGLSYGFAALSIAYLAGALAMLAAACFTFHRDYCEESPQPGAPLPEHEGP